MWSYLQVLKMLGKQKTNPLTLTLSPQGRGEETGGDDICQLT